jgi:hypothetical protein
VGIGPASSLLLLPVVSVFIIASFRRLSNSMEACLRFSLNEGRVNVLKTDSKFSLEAVAREARRCTMHYKTGL